MIDMEVDLDMDRLGTVVLSLFVLWFLIYGAWKQDGKSSIADLMVWGIVFSIAATTITVIVLGTIISAG
jgi:hypothetical protein